jgi:hypothetical protein
MGGAALAEEAGPTSGSVGRTSAPVRVQPMVQRTANAQACCRVTVPRVLRVPCPSRRSGAPSGSEERPTMLSGRLASSRRQREALDGPSSLPVPPGDVSSTRLTDPSRTPPRPSGRATVSRRTSPRRRTTLEAPSRIEAPSSIRVTRLRGFSTGTSRREAPPDEPETMISGGVEGSSGKSTTPAGRVEAAAIRVEVSSGRVAPLDGTSTRLDIRGEVPKA